MLRWFLGIVGFSLSSVFVRVVIFKSQNGSFMGSPGLGAFFGFLCLSSTYVLHFVCRRVNQVISMNMVGVVGGLQCASSGAGIEWACL